LDGDNPEHIKWLFETASSRATQYSITGVTYSLTQGVVKNIIPAIASTNALIAAACANEAFKLLTNSSTILNNYMMFMGTSGVYTHTFALEKNENCIVCGNASITATLNASCTLQDLIEHLMERSDVYVVPAVCYFFSFKQ
jgi:ubiquitin-activating enzyme E1 C